MRPAALTGVPRPLQALMMVASLLRSWRWVRMGALGYIVVPLAEFLSIRYMVRGLGPPTHLQICDVLTWPPHLAQLTTTRSTCIAGLG
jgi:hypothetical protein